MPNGGPDVQARVLLLPSDHLHSLLHAGHRLLGELLARPQRGSGPSLARRDDPAHHVDSDGLHQQLAAAGGLHKSYRCLDWGKTA